MLLTLTYTASRSIVPTHVSGTQYIITTEVSRLDRTVENFGTQNSSLGGATFTEIQRSEIEHNVTTVPLLSEEHGRSTSNSIMLEFLDSVSRGEVFEYRFDSGTNIEGMLSNFRRPYRGNRVGTVDIFSYSFSIKEIA